MTSQKVKSIIRKVGIGVAFVLVFIAVGFAITDVIRQKWTYSDNNAAQQIVTSYYDEPENSIDVLCLGASSVRNGVSALEMYHEYGFTTYSRATSVQLPVISYYLLQETLETQKLKAVVVDASTLTNLIYEDGDSLGGKVHEALDYMPMSKYKLNLIQEVSETEGLTALDYLLPIYSYHDRWYQLDKDDFTYRSWGDFYCYKGQYPTLHTQKTLYSADYMSTYEDESDSFYIMDQSAEYFKKMIQLCKDNNILFVLIKAPASRWSNYRHNVIQEFADENGIDFIDFSLPEIQDEIGFDESVDYYDSGRHLNITGAAKVSSYLGEFLVNHCELSDRREDSAYSSWNDCYDKYFSLLEDVELMRDDNIISYLEKIKDGNYITMIATRNDTSKYFNSDVAEAFQNLGIDTDFASTSYLGYLAVLNDGSLVYEDISADEQIEYSTVCDGHSISISSFANQLMNNSVSIEFDGEETAANNNGFNIVVYDKNVDQIVSSRAFNTGSDGMNYLATDSTELFKQYVYTDPVEYMKLLNNDSYLSIITAANDEVEHLPQSVNEQMLQMGLLPFEGEEDRPYAAILEGGTVIFNEYGDSTDTINYSQSIGNIDVSLCVSCDADGTQNSIDVNGDERIIGNSPGLCITVYDKVTGRRISTARFQWSKDYYANSGDSE